MLTAKKCLFVFMFCFLTASFSFHYLWAEEGSSPSNLQKAEEKQATAQKQPQITIAQPQFDMGEVYEGNTIVHAFAIKNTGTAELNINKVKAG
jgi:hypothetical protein